MKIFLGPAGVPISSKERSTLAGVQKVAELKLNAMEVEFVRGVKMTPQMAEEIGKAAKELNVSLTVHAPYFINLCSTKKSTVEASKRMILDSADRGEKLGAEAIAIHAAYYSGLTAAQAFKKVKAAFLEIVDKMKQQDLKIKLGIETMAKESQFGTLDEAIAMHKEVKQVIPWIDWAHLYIRNNVKINYAEIFEKLKEIRPEHIYSHFSNAKFNVKTKRFVDVHVPIDSHPPFELLAREILKRKLDITIISESPVLEQDSLKMKKVFEKLGYKF
jgi:deoxyribonuclease-4